jgi:hypothetical protein
LKEIFTRIEIKSSPEVVWRILTDFAGYPSWNSFIPSVEGELSEGALLRIKIKPPGGKAQDYRVRILRIQEAKEFRWLGHFHMPGLIDGEHVFEIEPVAGNKIQLVQREYFSGILVPLVWKRFLNTHLRQGFEELNQGLKMRAERSSAL